VDKVVAWIELGKLDPKIVHLCRYGGDGKDRSSALFNLAAVLGEQGVRPEVAITLIKYADEEWGKFSKRQDWQERIAQLFDKYSQAYKPTAFLHDIKPMSLTRLKEVTPEVNWAVQDLLAKQTYGLITGSTGVGKSTFAMQFGMAWAKGGEWNDYQFEKSRILFGSHEMGPNEVLYFSEKLQLPCPMGDEDIFHVLPIGQTVSVLTPQGRDFYLQYIDDYDVFMFDTVSSSTHLPMLDERSGPGLVAFFHEITGMGKTVIALGHDIKDAKKQGILTAESMYGHRILMDQASLIIRLDQEDPEDDEHVTVIFPKVRLARKPKAAVYYKDPATLWMSKTTDAPFQRKTTRKAVREAGFDDSQIKDVFG
jgi:hypothetical protein